MESIQVDKVNFLAPIQRTLQKVDDLMLVQASQHHPDLYAALKHLLSSGGKRIRPAVTLLAGRMLGGDEERLVTLASAIELLHTATLVHDDLIDGALLRRGIATLNARWSPGATVLTGDFIFARAAKLAADTRSVEVMRLFAEALTTVVNGEITQMFTGYRSIDRAEYNQRIYAKTASVFEVSTKAAAMLSPVSEEMIENMRVFGYQLGMAFQIVDDILDFIGDQTKVGKPLASDLRNGVVTLPVIYYLETFPGDEDIPALLDNHYSKRESDAAIDRIVSNVRKSGAVQQAMNEAKKYVNNGKNMLDGFADCIEKRSLIEIGNYIVDRQL